MCNAWNHPATCSCGWGGLTVGAFAGHQRRDAHQARVLISNFTASSACPVCRSPVFFFRDLNGGSVYFDELGPPWPKHPCTSTSSREGRSIAGLTMKVGKSANFQWQRNGWCPYVDLLVQAFTPSLLRVQGTVNRTPVEVFVPRDAFPRKLDPRQFIETSAVQCTTLKSGDLLL